MAQTKKIPPSSKPKAMPKPAQKKKPEEIVIDLNVESEVTVAEQIMLDELSEKIEEDKGKVSLKKLEQVTALVEEKFNLHGKGFAVRSADDKGNSYKLTLENTSFKLQVTIEDISSFGISEAGSND